MSTNSGAISDDNGSMNQAKKKGSFSMGAVVLLVGVIGLGLDSSVG